MPRKKINRQQLERKLWKVFSKYIRERDSVGGYGNCITCQKLILTNKAHAGHFVPRSCKSIKYDEFNVHLQCAGCNTYRGGEPILYRKALVAIYGEEEVNRLEEEYFFYKKGKSPKIPISDLRELLELYTNKLNEHLQTNN